MAARDRGDPARRLPGYVAGLKQGWAFSWRSLMAAEIIASGGTIGFGLGSMLQQSRDLADLAGVLATIIVILVDRHPDRARLLRPRRATDAARAAGLLVTGEAAR